MIKVTLDTGSSKDTIEAKAYIILIRAEDAYELHKYNADGVMWRHLLDDYAVQVTKPSKRWWKFWE